MKKKNWYKGLTATAITLAMTGAAFTVPALAIEYDLSNGDVYVDGTKSWQTDGENEFYYGYDASTDSWTNKTAGRYDHVANNDNQVDISHPSDEYNTGSVTVSGDASDLEISINAGDVGTTDTFLTVEEGTEANITVEDSTINAGEGEKPAMEINGGNVTFTGENTVFGSETAIEIGGNATVTVDAEGSLTVIGDNQEGTSVGTGISVTDDSTLNVDGKLEAIGSSSYGVGENAGTGVGVSVTDNGQVNVSGDLVAVGNSVNITNSGPMALSGENSDTDYGYDFSASGTGIELSGNADLVVEEGGSLLAVGTDVIYNMDFNDLGHIETDGSVGMLVGDTASADIEGSAEVYGSQLYVTGGRAEIIRDENVGLQVSDEGEATVSEDGSLVAKDVAAARKSGTGYGYTLAENGSYYELFGEYYKLNMVPDALKYKKNNDGTFTQYKYGTYILTGYDESGNGIYYTKEEISENLPSYNRQFYNNTATASGTDGVGIQLTENGQFTMDGGLTNVQGSTAVQLDDQSVISVDGGDLITYGTTNSSIHKSQESSVNISGDGYIFAVDTGSGSITEDSSTKSGYDLIDSSATTGNHFAYYSTVDKKYHVYWDIAADASGNQVIEVGDMLVKAVESHLLTSHLRYIVPGMYWQYEVNVSNHSKHTYDYLDGSLDMGFDLPDEDDAYFGCRYPNSAIQALYGVTGSAKVSLEQLMAVEQVLQTTGYNGKIYSLEEYGSTSAIVEAFYLDFINEQNGTNYTSFADAPFDVMRYFLGDASIGDLNNGIFTISPEEYNNLVISGDYSIFVSEILDDGRYKVQIKENNENITTIYYFYQYCLALGYGEDAIKDMISKLNSDQGANGKDCDNFYYLLQYVQGDELGSLWGNANDYINSIVFENGNFSFDAGWGIDGWNTVNAYQNFALDFDSSITLHQLDGILDLTKVDENGNTITSDEATFQIWYDDEEGVRHYLTLGEDGLYGFVTNESTVDTINGHLLVEYALLEGVNYNIKEVTAPDGYLLDDTTQVLILENSEDPFVLSVTNVAEEDDDDEEEEGDTPEIPEYPELPDYDPPEVDIDDPDVPLVEEPEEPEEPEQPTEEIDDEETPLTPSIPDEVVDEIIAEIEDEVTPLTSVPKTGAEMPAATAALPVGVLALAVSAVVRRIRRKD